MFDSEVMKKLSDILLISTLHAEGALMKFSLDESSFFSVLVNNDVPMLLLEMNMEDGPIQAQRIVLWNGCGKQVSEGCNGDSSSGHGLVDKYLHSEFIFSLAMGRAHNL